MLLLWRSDKLYTFLLEPLVFLVDVIYSQVRHYPERVVGKTVDLVVEAHVESDVAQLEGDEILVTRVQGKAQDVVVEVEHTLQVIRPKGHSYQASNHVKSSAAVSRPLSDYPWASVTLASS